MLAAAALCLAAVPASAQPVTPPAPESPPADSRAEAQKQYQDGVQAYNVGDFDTAVARWKEAYRLMPLPDFQFNIAQAYRGKRDYQNALFFYNAFLREKPDAPNLEEVVALRDEMQRLWDEEQAAKAAARKVAPPPETGTPATDDEAPRTLTTTTTQTDERTPGRGLKLTGIIVGSAGAIMLTTGVIFTMAASSAASDLEAAAERGDPWSDELADKESAGERNATLGAVLMAAGGAAIVAGTVTFVLGVRKDRAQSRVAIVPAGAGFVARVSF